MILECICEFIGLYIRRLNLSPWREQRKGSDPIVVPQLGHVVNPSEFILII